MKHIAPVAIIALCLSTMGCVGPLTEICQKALPVLNTTNAYANNANIALEQASDIIKTAKGKLSDADLYKAQAKLDNARLALQAASAAIVKASKLCTAPPSMAEIFHDFLAAWKVIRPFLAVLGGTGGNSVVADPMIWNDTMGEGSRQ